MNRIEWLRKLVEEERWNELSMALIDNEGVDALLDLAEATHSFEAFADTESGYKDGMTLFEHEEFWNEISTLREKLLPLLEEVEDE